MKDVKETYTPKKRILHTETVIWFGVHKGKKAKDCPLQYLIWCRDNLENIDFTTSLLIMTYEKRLQTTN